METMHYSEKKKSSKGAVIGLVLFVLIGGAIILFAVKYEGKPQLIGSKESDIQRLVDLEKEDEENTKNEHLNINYEVKELKHSDKSVAKIKSDITVPQIYIEGQELTELNKEIDTKYQELFVKLQSEMKSVESNYTFLVSYDTYENMVGTEKIISVVVTQKVRDDSAKKNTSESKSVYNIDLSTKEEVELPSIASQLLGKDYKTIIRSATVDYVVGKGMMKESEFTYAITGLEEYYVKDGVFHIIFNEGKLVDEKYGVLDIEVKEK